VAVAVCAGVLASLTWTVIGNVPETDGVPLICPPPINTSPAGNVPDVILQLYGVVPPVAAREAEYALFTCPAAKEDVVTSSACAPAATTILKFAVALSTGALLSVTFTVNENVPDAVGVPLICPPPLNVSPVGNVPELILQLYGVAPPLALSVAL
jgi:hypothetical protein